MGLRIGVCSWSLRASSPEDLAARARDCRVHRVQLALDPIRTGAWSLDRTRRALDQAGIEVVSAMMATKGEDYSTIASIRRTGGLRPDEHWGENLMAASVNARIAAELGVSLVTLHAGFLPEDPSNALHNAMLDRISRVAGLFEDEGVSLGLETGQESAEGLLRALEHPALRGVGVNFDPANMLLYGAGDPIEAIELLAGRVVQIHMKDATASPAPDEWGQEAPAGGGEVDWAAFFKFLRRDFADLNVLIERESGDRRMTDVRAAVGIAARYGAHP